RHLAHDGQCGWVDDSQAVVGLHVDEHGAAGGVVGDVAGLPAQCHGAAHLVGGGVDDGFGAAGFVGGPHGGLLRVVGQPVGVVPRGRTPEFGSGVLIQGDHLISAGGGGVHPVTLRNDQDAVDLRQVVDDAHHPVSVHIDFDHL